VVDDAGDGVDGWGRASGIDGHSGIEDLPGSLEAGARIEDLASPVPGGSELALHAGSADPAVLKAVFRHEYGALLDVNSSRLAQAVPGHSMNCTRCVIATDVTLDGAPSSAMPVTTRGDSIKVVTDFFDAKLSDFRPVTSYDEIVQQLATLGEGSRAIVYGGRPSGVGHVFNVIHDKNGVVFLDGQSGQFASLEAFSDLRLLITKKGL
jgi:hypothetical protein